MLPDFFLVVLKHISGPVVIEHLRKSIEWFAEVFEESDLFEVVYLYASISNKLGDMDKALEMAQKSVELAEDEDQQQLASALMDEVKSNK